MRTPRLLGEGRSFYHVISRVVDRRKVFQPRDKEIFRKIMRNLEAFMGVRIVTYCVMSNHFHLLLEVPDRESLRPLSEDELLDALRPLYDGPTWTGIKQDLERARLSGNRRHHAEILSRFEKRRGDLRWFVKELKQRVTLYMNKRLNRTGTLWEGRYKSILVEGNENALLTIAAYIDLNPVRAGLVQNPEDYRWCGYAEALSGTRNAKLAKRGLGIILAESLQDNEIRTDWRRTQSRYRQFLFEEGQEREANEQTQESSRRGFSKGRVDSAVKTEGELSIPAILRHRVRYFCDGAVLGTTHYVDEIFAREKESGHIGGKRTTGARKMRGAAWGDLRVLRDLQVDVIGGG